MNFDKQPICSCSNRSACEHGALHCAMRASQRPSGLSETGSATSEDYRVGIEALLAEPNIDIVMPWFVFQDTPLDESIVDILAVLSEASPKPILCGAMGGPYTERMGQAIEKRGVPLFYGVREWLAAARALCYRKA